VTLAGMLVFRGATQYLLEGQSIAPFPRSFGQVSSGFLPDIGGGNSLYHWPTVILGVLVMVAAVWQQVRQRRTQSRYGFDVSPAGWFVFKNAAIVAALGAFTLLLASYRGVPVVGIILAVMFVIFAFVMRSTVFGRQVYAVGGNVAAARLSGVCCRRWPASSSRPGSTPRRRRQASGWNWRPSPRRSSVVRRPAAVSARCSAPSSVASSSVC
jgi:putative multiple sugar transport system permease protein